MIVYLDSMIVIYRIEGPGPFRIRARARLAQINAAGDATAISHLIRLECRVKPIRLSDASLLADYDAFFNAPGLLRFSLPEPVPVLLDPRLADSVDPPQVGLARGALLNHRRELLVREDHIDGHSRFLRDRFP
jgi:hypothetical protein